MNDAIRQLYTRIRTKVTPTTPTTPVVLLHIGEEQTYVVSGTGHEPDQVLVLEMGASATSLRFFKHNPPSQYEIETAIMAVEDEVTRARAISGVGTALYSVDSRVHEMAHNLSIPNAVPIIVSIEQVERLFNQLAARSEGKLASQVDIPDDLRFAAALLILREFMHHLGFDKIEATQGL